MGVVSDRRGLMRRTLDRAELRRRLCSIAGGPRRLVIQNLTDTTTTLTSEPGGGSTIDWDADTSARRTARGKGAALAFTAASSHYGTQADADAQSFGDGAADVPKSWFALINTSDTAANKTIFSKRAAAGTLEYLAGVSSAEVLFWQVYDDSAGATIAIVSDAAIPLGSWVLVGGSYDGRAGASAHEGMGLFVNGAAVAATGSAPAGTYVAMENLASAFEIGSFNAHTAQFFQGSMALFGLTATHLSAAEHAGIYALVRRFYGI